MARETTVAGLGRFDIGWVIEIGGAEELHPGAHLNGGPRLFTGVLHSVRNVRTYKGVMPIDQYVVKCRTLGTQKFIETSLLDGDCVVIVRRKFVEREPRNPFSSSEPRRTELPDGIVWCSEK